LSSTVSVLVPTSRLSVHVSTYPHSSTPHLLLCRQLCLCCRYLFLAMSVLSWWAHVSIYYLQVFSMLMLLVRIIDVCACSFAFLFIVICGTYLPVPIRTGTGFCWVPNLWFGPRTQD
jgi:hypothetical protein